MLKNKFINLSLKHKILLYCIVILSFIMAFIAVQNYIFSLKVLNTIETKHYTIQSLENKIVVQSNTDILQYIQSQIEKNKIFINSIKTNSQTISLTINDTFKGIITLLYRLEQHLIIEEFMIEKDEKNSAKIKCKVSFLNKYFINQNEQYLKPGKIINPFYKDTRTVQKETVRKLKKHEKKTIITLDAIVNSDAFINGEWHKKGDILKNYKIITIKQNCVKLLNQKNNTIKIIKVSDDEK